MVCVRLKGSECAVSHSTHNRSCWRQADRQKGHLDQKKSFHLNFPSKTFACFPLTCSDYRKALSHSYWLAEHQQRQRHQTLLADTNTSYSWLCAFRTHQGTEEIHLEEQNPMTKVETDKVQETLNHTIIKLSRKLSVAGYIIFQNVHTLKQHGIELGLFTSPTIMLVCRFAFRN